MVLGMWKTKRLHPSGPAQNQSETKTKCCISTCKESRARASTAQSDGKEEANSTDDLGREGGERCRVCRCWWVCVRGRGSCADANLVNGAKQRDPTLA